MSLKLRSWSNCLLDKKRPWSPYGAYKTRARQLEIRSTRRNSRPGASMDSENAPATAAGTLKSASGMDIEAVRHLCIRVQEEQRICPCRRGGDIDGAERPLRTRCRVQAPARRVGRSVASVEWTSVSMVWTLSILCWWMVRTVCAMLRCLLKVDDDDS